MDFYIQVYYIILCNKVLIIWKIWDVKLLVSFFHKDNIQDIQNDGKHNQDWDVYKKEQLQSLVHHDVYFVKSVRS